MIIIVAILAVAFTFLGGLLALRFNDKLHLVLGFSAGAVIGVAFFDLLPESVNLGSKSFGTNATVSAVALGFVIYMILNRLLIAHCHETGGANECANENHRGRLGAGSLSLHSFLDGMAIGFAFQVSSAAGAVVAIAVLVHDFSDGINTVGLILKTGGSKREAMKWLALDAVAPALGVFATVFFSLEDRTLGIILALFCGFFLYIGASDLLPESHHRHPTHWTTFMTVLGVAVLYGAIRLTGI